MVSGYQANLEAASGDKVSAGYPEFDFVFCDHVFQARHRPSHFSSKWKFEPLRQLWLTFSVGNDSQRPEAPVARKLPRQVGSLKMEAFASSRKSDEEVPIHGVADPGDLG